MLTGVFPPRRGMPLAAHGNAVGLIRNKTMKPLKGRPMRKPRFRMDWAGEGALSGRIFFGDGFPMALPWAEREVPLAGRQIWRKSGPVF